MYRIHNRIYAALSALFLAAALWAVCSVQADAQGRPGVDFVPGEVIVGVRAEFDDPARAGAVVASVGHIVDRITDIHAYRVKLNPGLSLRIALARLRGRNDVRYAEPNGIGQEASTPNDTFWSKQYGPTITKMDQAWDLWNPQATVIIAIIDSGIDYNHPDLTNKVYRDGSGNIVGYNFINSTTNPLDDDGHGTHCSGIAAAQTNNGVGVAGMCGWNGQAGLSDATYTKIMPVKVLDRTGRGSSANLALGITWATDHHANVISMSLQNYPNSSAIQDAVQYAWGQGLVVVSAAGNDGSSVKNYPAAFDNVISVAATDRTDQLTFFTNHGSWVSTAAPGLFVYSTMPTYHVTLNNVGVSENYGYLSGTSQACPHVAGEAAFLMAQNPSLTNVQVRSLITAMTDPFAAKKANSTESDPLLNGPIGLDFRRDVRGLHIAPDGGRIDALLAVQNAMNTTAVTLSSLTLDSSDISSGNSAMATLTLDAPAPSGGVILYATTTSNDVVATPTGLFIPADAQSVTFPVQAGLVDSASSATVSVVSANTVSTALTVHPPDLTAITLSQTHVSGGDSTTGTVHLDGLAGPSGVTVSLSSSNPSVASVPSSVFITPDQNDGLITVTTTATSSDTPVTLTATSNGVSQSVILTVTAPHVTSLTLDPTTVRGGKNGTAYGTVTLDSTSVFDSQVALSASDPSIVTVPATITIRHGKLNGSFRITTRKVKATTTVTLSASFNGTMQMATLTVTP